MLLNFLLSVQCPNAFALIRFQLSFLHFQGLAHASEDAVHFIVVVTIDITFVLVVVVVFVVVVVVAVAVNAILLADDEIQFPHVPASTATVALAVVALFLSQLLSF